MSQAVARRDAPDRRSRHLNSRGRRRWVWIALAVGATYYLVNLGLVMRSAHTSDDTPTGAIVVLGAAQYNGRPSRQLAARLDHAVTLYERGVAPVVMVTGGNRQGDVYTEAEASRGYLEAAGIPADAIIAEDQGTNTFNSLERAAEVLHSHEIDSVVLVTDPFHAERSVLIAREVGLNAVASPTPTSVLSGWHQFRRELVEAGGVGVGRVIGFGRLSGVTG